MIQRHPGRFLLVPGWGLALVTAAVLLAACNKHSSPAPAVVIDSEITPQPVQVGLVTLTLKLRNSSAEPVSGAHITLEGDMSHPGMGPVFGQAKEIAPGRYQGALQLNMPGDWVVVAHVILANGQEIDHQIDVKGVQAN